MMRYLEKYCSNVSVKDQKNKLIEILSRLENQNFLDPETLREVVKALLEDEQWPMPKVLAHLDMIDLDERT